MRIQPTRLVGAALIALAVLAVVLTIFFLERDRLRFGRFFWLAAVFCGLATAIKLQGVFFFLTIPGYILAGLLKKKILPGRAALAAVGFVVAGVGYWAGGFDFLL